MDTKEPPAGIQVATFFNKDRDAINTAIFHQHCKDNSGTGDEIFDDAFVILMDNLEMKDGAKRHVPVASNKVKKYFWENCGEDMCKLPKEGRGRVDPMLKLYKKAPMMLTQNNDVLNGQANGSRVYLKKVNAKIGEEPFVLRLDCGTRVRALFASQVQSLLMEHENEDIRPSYFQVEATKWEFQAKLTIGTEKVNVSMKGVQFPIISNSVTTGHKLQGCTVDDILVNDWKYQKNWPYVVLSRVRTMAGLYLQTKLSEDLTKYSMSDDMLAMLQLFRDTISLPDLEAEHYVDE